MKLMIDGYNHLKSISGDSFVPHAQRERYISRISRYVRTKLRSFSEVIIVFDGGDSSYAHSERYENLRVVYAGYGQCADEWIVEHAGQDNAAVILVSSDVELRRRCKRSQLYGVTSQEFEYFVVSVLHTARDDADVPPTTAGGPRPLDCGEERDEVFDSFMREAAYIYNESPSNIDESEDLGVIPGRSRSKKEKQKNYIEEMLQ